MLNSVQQYAFTLTTGITCPLYTKKLKAYWNPPNPGKLLGPTAYVWATNGTNKRQTGARRHGFRKLTWVISTWLMCVGNGTAQTEAKKFAVLCDTVVNTWVTATMPIMYHTPVSGQTTQFLAIGEQYTIEQSPVHSLADQRLVLYEALLRFNLEEALVP